MAYKMTKAQTKQITAYVDELRTLRGRMTEAATRYNEILEEATEFVSDIGIEMQSQYDDASERWQESEKATAVLEWIAELTDVELTEIDIDEDDDDNVVTLEELPQAPDG